MTQAVKLLALIDILFIVFLIASGSTSGVLSDVIYYLGFLVLAYVGYRASFRYRREREEIRGLREPEDRLLFIDKETPRVVLPIIAPTVAIIFVSALLTSLLLTAFGFEQPPLENRPIFEMIIVRALAPALLEELLFRYIPMKLIMPYSKRWCVILSSLFFSLIHCSLFQIPYALVAGIILVCIDMITGSIWPSVIIHFVNNVLSLIWMKYCHTPRGVWTFVAIFGAVTLISLVFILKKRDFYKKRLIAVFERGEEPKDMRAPLALMALSLFIAVVNLLST